MLARPLAIVALLLAAAPAPVLAEASQAERERRNMVLGLAAIAAFGLILHERSEDRDEERERARRARTLPGECLVGWAVADGWLELYDPDCLEGSFGATDRLPLACAVTVRSDGRFVSGFAPGCLREEGWIAEG